MYKFIYAFQDSPSTETARRLLAYMNRHPMALCFADDAAKAALTEAKLVAKC